MVTISADASTASWAMYLAYFSDAVGGAKAGCSDSTSQSSPLVSRQSSLPECSLRRRLLTSVDVEVAIQGLAAHTC